MSASVNTHPSPICKPWTLAACALSALCLLAPTLASAQVGDTPAEREKLFAEVSQDEKVVVATAIAYLVRDAHVLCGFKLTAIAQHMLDGSEKFPTLEQKIKAEAVSNNMRPRAPLPDFCANAKEEFAHAPAKWFE